LRWTKNTVACAFALLTLWTAYWSVVAAPSLARDPRNVRLLLEERSITRGGIYARDGRPIAVNDPRTGRRVYVGPESLAHTIGYSDPLFGKSGLERAYNAELLGLFDGPALPRRFGAAAGRTATGWDVITTIDLDIQSAAEEALQGRKGAVVVLDPADGSVLAMASSPGFHPSRLGEVIAEGDDVLGPLFNRATMGQYPPGSAFKPVILAAALESRAVGPEHVFDDRGFIVVNGMRIDNAGEQAHGTLALDDALAVSSNAAFAELALKAGAGAILETSLALGIGVRPEIAIPASAGRLPPVEELADSAALALIGIGQGTLLVTPLQMAKAAAAIANGGWTVEPRLVASLRSPDGAERPVAHPKPVRAISAGTAHLIRESMIRAVESGTGSQARAPGIAVAGKTGTAENPHGRPHAWFIGFAPARSPRIAFAVVVENGGGGGSTAAPVARAIVSRALVAGSQGD